MLRHECIKHLVNLSNHEIIQFICITILLLEIISKFFSFLLKNNNITKLYLIDGFRVLQNLPLLKRISSSRLRKASKKTKVIYGYSCVLGSHFNSSNIKELLFFFAPQ
jgi:hypothetical protein